MFYKEKVVRVKQELNKTLEQSDTLAVVGRIKSWLKNSESKYPISCTVLKVKDSMEGEDGIEFSWLYTSKGIRYAAGVAVDISDLRPAGTDNGKGLISSGVASFARFYSLINEELRRGGVFRNGAVVIYYDAAKPDLPAFLNISSADIPWAKRALYIDDNPESPDYILNNPYLEDILNAVRTGVLWLAKKRWFLPITGKTVNYPPVPEKPEIHRLLSQVCLEILLPSKGTCLLSHVNLGKCTLNNLVPAFKEAMEFLCKLHAITGAGRDNYYLSPNKDKQVGLGVLGLANLLAQTNIKYSAFADALCDFFEDSNLVSVRHNLLIMSSYAKSTNKSYGFKELRLVKKLHKAIKVAAKVARKYKMKRAFTVAPTATVSYLYEDLKGYTTAPEISPPICHTKTKQAVRDSYTNNSDKVYQYPLNVESAEEVGWNTYYKLAKAWQLLMESTGLAHSISFNVWNDCPVDLPWFVDWLKSPLVTTYYRMLVDQNFTDKTAVNSAISQESGMDDFFIPENNELDNILSPSDLINSYLNGSSVFNNIQVPTYEFPKIVRTIEEEEPLKGFCSTEGYCVSCAE